MIILTNDHGGVKLKTAIVIYLEKNNIDFLDLGDKDSSIKTDIPSKVIEAVKELKKHKDAFGVFICTSGVGASITANRHKGVHAVLASSVKLAIAARQHNNANVICFGDGYVKPKLAIKMLDAFIKASPLTEQRYKKRRDIIDSIKC